MKTKLPIIIALLFSAVSFSQTFTFGNINYEVIDANLNTVSAVGGSSLPNDLVIPDTVTDPDTSISYTVTTIGNSAFRNKGLTSVILPQTLTTLEFRAFRDNGGINSITIPANVTSVGNESFFNNSLTKIISLNNTPPSIANGTFGRDRSAIDLFIPENTTTDYENEGWTGFGSVLEGSTPIAICQSITIQLGTDGQSTITTSDVDGGSSDNAGIAAITVTSTNFDCTNLGENEVVLTVTGLFGNSSSCAAIVTVEDVIFPTVECRDITIQLDTNNEAFISISDIGVEITDNCNIDTTSISKDTFGIADIGENEVTLTAVDQGANSSSCIANVTVVANDFPIALCQDVTIPLDETGQATISASNLDAGSTDIVGVASITVTPNSFDCSNIGSNEVTLTVTNTRGNSSSCIANVIVEDRTAPILICPADITLECSEVVTYEIELSDCAFPVVPTIVDGFTLLGTFGASTYFISDETSAYNVAFAEAEQRKLELVTVNTREENNFLSQVIGDLGIERVLIGLNDITTEDSFEWQSGQPVVFTNFASGEPNNQSNEDFVELIINNGLWNDALASAVRRYVIEFQDYTGGPILISGLSSGNFFPTEATTNTFFAKDSSGNIATCSFIVSVEDDIVPSISCPADIIVDNDPSLNEAFVRVPAPIFSDNCGEQVIPDTFNVLYNFNESGDLINTPATLSGLSTTSFDVVLELTFTGDHDSANEVFVLTDPDGEILATNNSSSTCSITNQTVVIKQETWNEWINTYGDSLTFTLLENGSVDNNQCGNLRNNFFRLRLPQFGNVTITNDYTNTSDASGNYPIGTTIVNWTVRDNIGNSTSCEQIITVNDTEAPVVTCADDIIVNIDEGNCSAIVNFDIPTASDNFTIFDTTLESILKKYNTDNQLVSSLIPNAFNFELDDGLNSDNIDDGGDDMYDGGNFISTDLSSGEITYSDNVIVSTTDFGINGAYFTRKVENMWLLAADLDGINDFNITGELGADGSGLADGFTSTITFREANYTLFVKRVREELEPSGGSDPSVNHLIIIPENTATSQNFSDDTDDDQHQVTGLLETTRLYYLLFAGDDSTFIDDATMEAIATSFIENIATPKGAIAQTTGLPSGSEFPVGETLNTFEATDEFGNTASCSFTVTVNETVVPIAVCQDITVQLDENGQATITAQEVDGGSTDNCGIADISIDVDSFDCESVGENTVTLTVTDNSGNVDSCTATITVEDTTAPQISCPTNQSVGTTYQLPDYFATGEAVATGTCTNPLVTFTQNPAPGTLLEEGVSTVTLCAADALGNEICCSFELTTDATLSIEDLEQLGSIRMYPNPASDIVHISNPSEIVLDRIAIYDVNGRLIISDQKGLSDSDISINISGLESGPYFVIIQGKQGRVTKQLIKK
ncbi:HYR domain-containing protein [uncultured Aquimarina sp.]|uniref:HYR domain-containing protein n=1 Tax=uncultured Aquimarina sp. TaxID=575652 RepID=UPI00261C5649|nr:HYR domain-containing protein [uncultured Aquimarina sp.]